MKRYMSTRPGLFQSGTNTALVITFQKDPDRSHRLAGAHFSYDADPTGGSLLIEVLDPDAGSTWRTVGKYFITKSGPGPLEFVSPFETPTNTGLRVTLAAGGSGINSTLDCSPYELVGR